MRIRLVATDVDGTILPYGGVISEETKQAVRACEAAGVPFVIASGRWYVSARDIAIQLGQKDGYMIIANGGAIVQMDGTPVKEWSMKPEDVAEAHRLIRRRDVMMNAFVPRGIFRINTQALKSRVMGLRSYFGEDSYRIVNDDQEQFESVGLKNPYKLEAYGDDPAVLAELREELIAAGLSVSSSYPTNLEIMSQGMGKGAAVRWLAASLGIDPSECMAFGDNTNDRLMLEAVGWPVAVGNAVDELKAAARMIAPDCDKNGVAQTVMRALRGELG